MLKPYTVRQYEQDAFICPIEESILPTDELEIRKVWNSLSNHTAIYFATLDKFTYEDDFFVVKAVRDARPRMADAGFVRVGQLVEASEEEVQARAGLSDAEMAGLRRVVGGLGLTFGMDVTAWRSYRDTVPPTFRLKLPYGMRLPKDKRSARLT